MKREETWPHHLRALSVPLPQRNSPSFALIFLVLALVIGAGLFYYQRQLEEGLVVTGLNTQVSWGIYIVNFIFALV